MVYCHPPALRVCSTRRVRSQFSLSLQSRSLGIVFFLPVEWRLFSLRLLSETTTLLVSQELEDGDEETSCDSDSSLLELIRDELLPQ